jgi:hypothetical protein
MHEGVIQRIVIIDIILTIFILFDEVHRRETGRGRGNRYSSNRTELLKWFSFMSHHHNELYSLFNKLDYTTVFLHQEGLAK